MKFIYIIQNSVFIGFGVFTILTLILSFIRYTKVINFHRKIESTSIKIIRLFGLAFILLYFTRLFIFSKEVTFEFSIYLIIPLLIFGIIPQLFWIKAFRKSRILKLLIAIIFVLFSNFEKFVILITSYHQDYMQMPKLIYAFFKTLILDSIFSLGLYSIIVTIWFFKNLFFPSEIIDKPIDDNH